MITNDLEEFNATEKSIALANCFWKRRYQFKRSFSISLFIT